MYHMFSSAWFNTKTVEVLWYVLIFLSGKYFLIDIIFVSSQKRNNNNLSDDTFWGGYFNIQWKDENDNIPAYNFLFWY